MNRFLTIAATALDGIGAWVGRWVAWFATLLVLVQFAVVVLRYAFGTSFIAMQEAVIYLNAALFMLAIGYTYLRDGHVRVDVLSARWGARARAVMELIGIALAVLPFCALIVWASWSYVLVSWTMGEGPMSHGGLPLQPLFKTLIPAMAVLLAAQAAAVAARAILVLRGAADDMFPGRTRHD